MKRLLLFALLLWPILAGAQGWLSRSGVATQRNDATVNNNAMLHVLFGSYNYTNVVVVDAGHGSDSNPLKFGYATLGAAQTNAHAGDTILVRSGSYSSDDVLTNGAVNWYLENGASVSLGEVIYGPALNIYGYGDINAGVAGANVNNAPWHIECRTVGGLIDGNNTIIGYIKADTITGISVITDTASNSWEFHANTIVMNNLTSNSGSYHPLVKFYCNVLQYDQFGELSVQTNSVFSAVTFSNVVSGDMDLSFSPVVWAVGYSQCNSQSILFAPGTRFAGSPMFDHTITSTGAKGSVQIVP